jgi:type IV pilus assembly protein PilO
MAAILDKIQKIPPRTRLIVFLALIVLLFVAYILQFQIPMNTEIKNLEQALSGLHAKIQDNDNKIRNLDALKSEVKILQMRLAELTEQLPPESEVSGLLRQIQNLVNQSGLVLKLWRPEKRRTHESGLYEEIPISLSLVGGYHNTAILFDRIGTLPRIVNVLNIKMGGAKVAKDGSLNIEINCTAMTFAAAEKKGEATTSGKKTQ